MSQDLNKIQDIKLQYPDSNLLKILIFKTEHALFFVRINKYACKFMNFQAKPKTLSILIHISKKLSNS